MASPAKLLTVEELAEFLDLTTKTVYRKVAAGQLPCYRFGSTLRFSLEEVLEAGRGTPTEAKSRSKKVASVKSKKVANVQLAKAPGGGKVTRLPGSR